MKKRVDTSIVLSLLICSMINVTFSNDEYDFQKMSLEDLMKIPVTSSSKIKEPFERVSSIMEIVTQAEIQQSGAVNLAEVLDKQLSFWQTPTIANPNASVSIRGDAAPLVSSHILLLINGRPFRENVSGSFSRSYLTSFPLSVIDRVEIIRGPGSVIHGGNAYTGIINIVTRSVTTPEQSIEVQAGTKKFVMLDADFQHSFDSLKVSSGIYFQRSDGRKFTSADINNVIETTSFPNLNGGFFLNGSVDALQLNLFAGLSQTSLWSTTSPSWVNPPSSILTEKRLMSDLMYKFLFIENLNTKLFATYNFMAMSGKPDADSAKDDYARVTGNDFQVELMNDFNFNENIQFIFGDIFGYQTGNAVTCEFMVNNNPSIPSPILPFNVFQGINPNPFETIPEYSLYWNAAYVQTILSPCNWMNIIAGTQIFTSRDVDPTVVFRGGIVLYDLSGLGFKLLHAQAFRPNSGVELHYQFPGFLYGNDMLRPEFITTTEVNASYRLLNNYFEITYFRNNQKDLVTRSFPNENLDIKLNGTPIPRGAQAFINRNKMLSDGIEILLKCEINKNLRLNVGHTSVSHSSEYRNASGIDTTVPNYYGMANALTKISIDAYINSWLNASVWDSWYSKFNDAIGVKSVNPSPKEFHDISLIFNFSLLFINNDGLRKSPIVFFKILNLLDNYPYVPEFFTHQINSIPGRERREFIGGITLYF